ncbi:putative triphosphatase [Helianthus annuus]|uniref:Hydrolase n=1 Tax=Helianthus annuus TaxID=4232 RepID=A0A9K3N709_HELAN|nr:triphosphate tunnel metalloenzyme 3-like [Helianthus annuus]KAF5789214.1 putative hydrolase [Helianthus annuus]KAJ0540958.1 putative triphosphatase [Helianthus annuus]KAJ0886482.1 putative triphosphatase [Helianthus annuus]
MEVEVKLRLPDSNTYKTLTSLLAPFHVRTHNQHNNFFDGAAGELSGRRAVLRIRFYNDQPARKCIICLKAKAVLINGVSRVEEDEEEIDFLIGEECLANPNRLGGLVESCRIMKRVKDEFFGGNDNNGELGLVCLGGFKNLRNVYEWKGLVIEVDETSFEFGSLYEIECESSEPEKAKELIEEFLKENGVGYSDSVASKFAIFRSGKLP